MIATADGPSIHNKTAESIAEFGGDWYAAQVKSRQEKKFAEDCNRLNLPFFLPMVCQQRVHGGQKRMVDVAIFPGYVFFCGDGNTRYEVLSTNRVCKVIAEKNQGRLRSELIDLERAIASAYQIDLYSFAAVGRRVRVKSGPLMGVCGRVTQRDGQTRIRILVSMLGGAGAELVIDADLLESCE